MGVLLAVNGHQDLPLGRIEPAYCLTNPQHFVTRISRGRRRFEQRQRRIPVLLAPFAVCQVAVPTYHNDNARTGLNAQEAIEKIDGKPLLADGVAESTADLVKKAGVKGEIVSIELSCRSAVLCPDMYICSAEIAAMCDRSSPNGSVPGRRFALLSQEGSMIET